MNISSQTNCVYVTTEQNGCSKREVTFKELQYKQHSCLYTNTFTKGWVVAGCTHTMCRKLAILSILLFTEKKNVKMVLL